MPCMGAHQRRREALRQRQRLRPAIIGRYDGVTHRNTGTNWYVIYDGKRVAQNTYEWLYSPMGGRTTPSVTSATMQPRVWDDVKDTVHQHSGTDLAATTTTALSSPENGKVVKEVWNDCHGNMLIIQLDTDRNGVLEDLWVQYSHLTSYSVSEGQWVEANEQVGVAGKTGSCLTGAHLHFELYNSRDLRYTDLTNSGTRVPPHTFFNWISTSWARDMQFIKELQVVDKRYVQVLTYANDGGGAITPGTVRLWYKLYLPYATGWYSLDMTAKGSNLYEADLGGILPTNSFVNVVIGAQRQLIIPIFTISGDSTRPSGGGQTRTSAQVPLLMITGLQ